MGRGKMKKKDKERLEKAIREYQEKGGKYSQIVRQILSGEKESSKFFLENIIHEYDDLSFLDFDVLVDIKLENDSMEQIRERIEKLYAERNVKTNNGRSTKEGLTRPKPPEPPELLKPPELQKTPEPYVDSEEVARECIGGIISCFTKGTSINSEGLQMTKGEKDIPLIDFFEYLYSDDRLLIENAIGLLSDPIPSLIGQSNVQSKPNKYKALAQLEILLRVKDGYDRKYMLELCQLKVGTDDFFTLDIEDASVHGHNFGDIINRKDIIYEDIEKIFTATGKLSKKTREEALKLIRDLGTRPDDRDFRNSIPPSRFATGVKDAIPPDGEHLVEK